MNASSSFEKIQICLVIKKLIWFIKKIRSIFVYVKKIVFSEEKPDLSLLNKIKPIGLKISDLFLRTKKKLVFGLYVKKIRSVSVIKNLDL